MILRWCRMMMKQIKVATANTMHTQAHSVCSLFLLLLLLFVVFVLLFIMIMIMIWLTHYVLLRGWHTDRIFSHLLFLSTTVIRTVLFQSIWSVSHSLRSVLKSSFYILLYSGSLSHKNHLSIHLSFWFCV